LPERVTKKAVSKEPSSDFFRLIFFICASKFNPIEKLWVKIKEKMLAIIRLYVIAELMPEILVKIAVTK
jgi:hypothetical protein